VAGVAEPPPVVAEAILSNDILYTQNGAKTRTRTEAKGCPDSYDSWNQRSKGNDDQGVEHGGNLRINPLSTLRWVITHSQKPRRGS
jgi:hypothetical protein